MAIKRMWVNQPSTLQMDNEFHGALVLADMTADNSQSVRVWFTGALVNGRDIESMQMLRTSLSEGWPKHLRPRN